MKLSQTSPQIIGDSSTTHLKNGGILKVCYKIDQNLTIYVHVYLVLKETLTHILYKPLNVFEEVVYVLN